MHHIKMKKIFLVLIAIIFIFPAISFAESKYYIGYGSANSVLDSSTLELVLGSFEIGLRQTLKDQSKRSLVLTEMDHSGSQLGALRVAKSLKEKGAIVLVGFPSSHEAILASKYGIQNDMWFFSSSAGHSELDALGAKVYSISESTVDAVRASLKHIKEHQGGKRGLVVINPKAVFSVNQDKAHKELVKQPEFENLKFDVVYLNEQSQLDADVIKKLKEGLYGYLSLTMYSLESVELMKQFDESKIDLPIYNTTWDQAEIDVIRRFIYTRKSSLYIFTPWVPDSAAAKNFERIIRKAFDREPVESMAYGFDLGVVIGTLINRIDGPLTPESFAKALKSSRCFEGTTSGRLCLPQNGGHSERKINVIDYMSRRKDRLQKNENKK